MKFIGLLAVIGSCLGIGWIKINAVRLEIRTMDALLRGVRVIRSELSGRLCPMRELLLLAAAEAGEDCDFFLVCADRMEELNRKSFSSIWSETCRSCLKGLSEENLRTTDSLGSTLGRYEMDVQLAACDRYLRSCEQSLKELRYRLPEQRRLTLALSSATGIFLCLLIL